MMSTTAKTRKIGSRILVTALTTSALLFGTSSATAFTTPSCQTPVQQTSQTVGQYTQDYPWPPCWQEPPCIPGAATGIPICQTVCACWYRPYNCRNGVIPRPW